MPAEIPYHVFLQILRKASSQGAPRSISRHARYLLKNIREEYYPIVVADSARETCIRLKILSEFGESAQILGNRRQDDVMKQLIREMPEPLSSVLLAIYYADRAEWKKKLDELYRIAVSGARVLSYISAWEGRT